MKDLRITTIQADLIWEDKKANLKMFDQKIAAITTHTDLIILPEMFTTGFSMNAASLAEDMDGETKQWMAKKAKEKNAVITGSFIAKENGHFYNRLVWMQADGEYQVYDKRHLFGLANEDANYTAGTQKLIVELKGWKICPLICYDLRFPVWSRNVENYDLLIYMANWPNKRSNAWKALLTARAIENQAYTIGVNRIGNDGMGANYSGDTRVVDYLGHQIYQASFTEDVFTTSLSYENQQMLRGKLNFLADRDHFKIELS